MKDAVVTAPRTWWKGQPLLAGSAAGFVAVGLLFFVPMLLDERTVLGLNPWIKPQKFAFSIAIFLGTMAWILPAHRMPGRLAAGIAWIYVLVGVVEVVLIAFQAGRGTISHYNYSSKFDGGIYAAMGIAIVIATLAAFVAACTPLREGVRGPALRWGVRCGEVVFLVGCVWGGFMSPRSGHSIGGVDGGPGLPIVNWSTTHGDLRVAHFVLLHGLQVLPLVGFALDRWLATFGARRWLVVAAMCGMLALAAWAARMALLGLPIVRG